MGRGADIVDSILHGTVVVLIRLLKALPLGTALALGRALGAFAYHVLRIRRRTVLLNLRHILGEGASAADLRRIARSAYGQFAMTLVEVLRCSVTEPGQLDIDVEIEGLDRLHACRAAKTPLIFCFAHAGNVDLVGFGAAAAGLTIHAVMKPLKSLRFNRLLVGSRERHGIRVLMKGADAFLELVEVLEGGGMVALLPDQNPRTHGVRVDFLGQPAATFKGPAVLHLLTGATLVVGIDERRADDPRRHVVHLTFLPPHEETGDRDADIRAVTQRMSDSMGELIRRNPAQYFWFHKRWGTRHARPPAPAAAPTSPAAAASAPADGSRRPAYGRAEDGAADA